MQRLIKKPFECQLTLAKGRLTEETLLYNTDLSKVIKVILSVDPTERRSFVETVRLVPDIRHIRSIAVVESSLEQLAQDMLTL